MFTPPKKGRFLSDKLQTWHVVLLAALVIGLLGLQWVFNERAEKEDVPRPAIEKPTQQ